MAGESPSSTNEQEQQRLLTALRESEILRELAELLASSLDLKRTLQVLTKRTCEVCEVERCSVWLVKDECHIFHPAAYYLSTQHIDTQHISAADHIWYNGSITFDDQDIFQLLKQHGIVNLPDLRARPGIKSIADTFVVRSILLVALKREGRIVGMLSLDDPGKTRTFSVEQQLLVRAIGQQAALAIDNARLYQEAQKARQRSERLIERAHAINEVAVSVHSGADLEVVLEIATRRLVHGLDARSGAIVLLEEGVLRPVSSTRGGPNLAATVSPTSLAALPNCKLAALSRAPLFVPSQQAAENERAWFSALELEHVLIIPLMIGASSQTGPWPTSAHPACLGFAFMNFSKPDYAPGNGRLAFAQDIAAQCAIAVEKAQLLSDLHRAAALANERANTLNTVFQAMTEGITVLDQDGQVLVRNAAAAHFLGVPVNTRERLETFLQRYPTYSLHGLPLAVEDFPLSRALKGDRIRGERFVAPRVDGVERVIEVNVTPLLDESGEQIGLVCAFRDITEQTQAERRIRQALETMLHVAEAVSGITEIKDILYSVLQRTLLTLNCHRGLVQLYDAEQQTFIPLMSIGFSTEAEAQWLLEQSRWLTPEPHENRSFPAQLRDGHATVIQSKHLLADALNPILVLAAPIMHHDRLMGLMMLDRSPTIRSGTLLEYERREFSIWDMAVIEGIAQLTGLAIEQARLLQLATNARSNEAAMREANALKDDFLAITAHEFRSPLTVILAHTQMALRQLRRPSDQKLSSSLIDSLTSIEGQAHQLTNIVNTFLEVTQLNSGQLVIKAEVVDLAETARQVAAGHRATSPQHEISCAVAPADHPYLVKGDSSRLAQIIANLLQNAIKYSPLGGPISVMLRQYVSEDSAHGRTIEVCVTDQGIGIPQEALPRLFERFFRAQNIAGSKTKGIGLGLYVVAELLHLQGGTIWAESSGVLGEGSRFIFTLPALESDTRSGD